MNDWLARVSGEGPIYLALVRALEAAVRSGELQPGDQLPAQRAVAQRLGVDFTTVTRAYSLARERGLVDAAVGRGTFISARPLDEEAGLVDLSMNLPPPPEGLSLSALIADTARAVLQRTDPAVLLAYHPGAGALGQKRAAVAWLKPSLERLAPEQVLLSPGAQSAMSAVLAAVCRPGVRVAAEPLTYPGFRAAAAALRLRLTACEPDDQGLRPDALERAHREAPVAAVYVTPTMQNPVATTMGETRRRELGEVATRLGIWIIEDDPYARLMAAPPPAIASFAPERTFHIATFSKCLSPGLRIAYLVCPPDQTEGAAAALRAFALMPAPLTSAVVTAWIREGTAEDLVCAVRREARARRALAKEALPEAHGAEEGLHVWRPLPESWSHDRLLLAAQARGLSLVGAEAFAIAPGHAQGVRVSLGGPSKRNVLAAALAEVADLLSASPPPRGLVV